MSIVHIGITLSFLAMLSWGIGDFFIQKSARKVGDWEALFFMSLFGAIILAPFAYTRVFAVFGTSHVALVALVIFCITFFLASIFDFEALRIGKLAVVEPIWSSEVPVSALLAFFIIGERISSFQVALIVILLVGLALVSLKNVSDWRKFIFEKGTIVALVAAILMGGANFFMGWTARLIDPITANFVVDIFVVLVTCIFLITQGKMSRLFQDMVQNRKTLLFMAIPDKIAWVAFAFAMSLAPIGVVVALSESYIIIAVILGLAVNKEKIKVHQKWGLCLAILSAVVLASITG